MFLQGRPCVAAQKWNLRVASTRVVGIALRASNSSPDSGICLCSRPKSLPYYAHLIFTCNIFRFCSLGQTLRVE